MITLYCAYLDDANDRRQLEDIYYSYRKQMALLALSILGQREDAEDAVSSVFLQIAEKNWNTVRAISSERDLRNYLLKATKHAAISLLREKKRAQRNEAPLSFPAGPDMDDAAFLDRMNCHMESQRVKAAIAQLDEVYRDALYFHFVLEMSTPETARALGLTQAATKKRLYRGKQLLLTMLEGDENCGKEE